jgi:hypothetical protein
MPPLPDLVQNLDGLLANFPLMSSRLSGAWWVPGAGPGISVLPEASSPLEYAPLQPFNLREEAPIRIVTSTDRQWLLLCAHHFAFDGLGMVALLRGLLTGVPVAAPDYTARKGKSHRPTREMLRIIRPADRVVASTQPSNSDAFASLKTDLTGPGVTARLASACTQAAREHNASHHGALRRIGLSVAVKGAGRQGATYRRVDLPVGRDVKRAVEESLADPLVPPEISGLPPAAFLLRPLMGRFSDTLLISNLGRLDLPGVRSVEFYPVARGRSAVAVGAAGLAGQTTTLTLRARDLDQHDAVTFLERIAHRLPAA